MTRQACKAGQTCCHLCSTGGAYRQGQDTIRLARLTLSTPQRWLPGYCTQTLTSEPADLLSPKGREMGAGKRAESGRDQGGERVRLPRCGGSGRLPLAGQQTRRACESTWLVNVHYDAINLLHSITFKCAQVTGMARADGDTWRVCKRLSQYHQYKHNRQLQRTRWGGVQPTS